MGQSVFRHERLVFQTAGVTTGNTAVYTIPTNDAAHIDQAMRIIAYVFITAAAGAHMTNSAQLIAELCVDNNNGTVTATAAIATSTNPTNSNTAGGFLTSRAEVRSTNVNTSTAVWTVAANVATLTITNSAAAGGVTADITAYVEVMRVGST
jgi:hypothetical protein